MLFKRRDKRTKLKYIKDILFPKKGWRRALEYISYRLIRIPDTPHRIALGLSCGVFVSFLPIFGGHFIIGALLAYIIKGDIFASLIGTIVGNPITFPIIAGVSINLGQYILGQSSTDMDDISFNWEMFKDMFSFENFNWYFIKGFGIDIFLPYLLGGTILGIIASLFFYFLCKPFVRGHQHRRKRKKMLKLNEKKKLKQDLYPN